MPDVLLTLIAQRRGFRAAIVATVCAVLGACLGGALMWRLGRDHQASMIALLDWLPAISPEMIASAAPVLARNPFDALVEGAFSGVPYKVFAALAAHAGISLAPFLLITIPARAARFLLASAATVAGRPGTLAVAGARDQDADSHRLLDIVLRALLGADAELALRPSCRYGEKASQGAFIPERQRGRSHEHHRPRRA